MHRVRSTSAFARLHAYTIYFKTYELLSSRRCPKTRIEHISPRIQSISVPNSGHCRLSYLHALNTCPPRRSPSDPYGKASNKSNDRFDFDVGDIVLPRRSRRPRRRRHRQTESWNHTDRGRVYSVPDTDDIYGYWCLDGRGFARIMHLGGS